MKKGTLLKKIGKFLVFGVFCILVGFSSKECKAENTTVTIKTKSISGVNNQDISYSLWKVSEENDSLGKLKEQLDIKTLDELNVELGNAKKVNVGSSGVSRVTLQEGIYYAKAFINNRISTEISSFIFSVSKDEKYLTITPKIALQRGGLKVFKYEQRSGKKIPLQGVQFSIYPENEWQPLKFKNNMVTTDLDGVNTLETDSNGEINVSGLLPGKYYIEEVKALEGFKALSIKILVNVETNKKATLEVENERIPTVPPKDESFLPKTGIQTVEFGTLGLSLMIFTIFLVRRKNKEK